MAFGRWGRGRRGKPRAGVSDYTFIHTYIYLGATSMDTNQECREIFLQRPVSVGSDILKDSSQGALPLKTLCGIDENMAKCRNEGI